MNLDKANIKKILGIIVFAILLYISLQKLDIVASFFASILDLVFPFILGAAIAFFLNVPMRGIENLLFERKKKKKAKNPKHLKAKRPLSLLITLFIVIGIIFLVLFLVGPEIGRTIIKINEQIPDFIQWLVQKSTELMEEYPDLAKYMNQKELDWEETISDIYDFFINSGGNMLKSTISIASSIIGGVADFFLGFIFAIYILLQKEKLGRQIKKVMYAYLPEQVTDKIISICSLSSEIFSKFLSGQCLEAVILGTMFFIIMSIFHFPYTLLISVLIGFTALIPVFGAFIGCFIGTLLILIVDPVKALWFIVLFIVLQQIEGNIIYPRVVGSSVGLPSIWVLVAVTIGGNLMGVVGMLIFIPMTSVIYTLLREAVNKRIRIRKVSVTKYKSKEALNQLNNKE